MDSSNDWDPGYNYGGTPDEEACRLTRQASSFVEHDLPLLQRFGLSSGMAVLDVGCGAGKATLEIARLVFPGKVTGLDRDAELLQRARENARMSQIMNVEFVEGDITDPHLAPSSFDFVYCRFVLWSVPERKKALRNMIRLVKPGGIVCAQEPDASGAIYWPELSAHKLYWKGRIRYHQDRQDGVDPNLGRKLYALFVQIGLTDIKVAVSALYKENFEWQENAERYVGPGADAVRAGYISEDVLKKRAQWARDPLSFMMFPTILVAGRRQAA